MRIATWRPCPSLTVILRERSDRRIYSTVILAYQATKGTRVDPWLRFAQDDRQNLTIHDRFTHATSSHNRLDRHRPRALRDAARPGQSRGCDPARRRPPR